VSLVSLLIPDTLEPRQAVRLGRLGVASLTYVLTSVFVGIAYAVGMIAGAAALQILAAYLAINAGLYAAIRSGFNLRFKDPSLTRFQIVVGITMVMVIAYRTGDNREVVLFGCFLVFLFGIFRLTAREFVAITLYTLLAYLIVMALLLYNRPEVMTDMPRELVGWLMLAGFLPCFNIIGAQFNALRLRLRESEARFRSLSEMSSDFHWETDPRHRLVLTSSEMPGGATNALGKRRWQIPYLTPDAAAWRAHRATLDAHRPFRGFELSRLADDGSEQHVAISGDPVFDAVGCFMGYRGVGTDISARKRYEHALRDGAEKLRLFADNIPAMTAWWDESLRCRFANRAFTDFIGKVPGDIVGKHVRVVLGEEMYRELEGHFIAVQKGHSVTYGSVRPVANGESRYLEIRVVPNLGEHGKVDGCFSVIADITGHKQAEQRIQRIAHHDGLTGLPNRLLFNDRLDQAVRLAQRSGMPFALLYIDLDEFKPVNDTFGHAAGDELLKAVAGGIRRQVRDSDTVARLGGDEFAVVLLDIGGRAQAEAVAAKIVAALALPMQMGSATRRAGIGSSIGIALFPDDAAEAQSLLAAADAAMYLVKQSRRQGPAGNPGETRPSRGLTSLPEVAAARIAVATRVAQAK
jgi:diguanylate cyclase (GGDEF)-like protein/PAS domain S-box-containing protein